MKLSVLLFDTSTAASPLHPFRTAANATTDYQTQFVSLTALKYTHWKQQEDTLMLSGLSIGNGVSFAFTDTCRFQLTHTDTLVLQYSYGKQVFWRR